MTACKFADITGNSRISKFAGFSLIKKLTGQELFETIELKNPHEYIIDKIEFIPGTSGSEFVSSELKIIEKYKNHQSCSEWTFDIAHWKKDGNSFKPKVLHKSKPINYPPGFVTLGVNKLITYGHTGGNAFIWQKDKDNETFKKTKLDSNGYIILKIKVAPWFNGQMFIAGLLNSDLSSSKLQLCKVEGKTLKTIIDLGTEKSIRNHYANFADDKEIVIYCSKNQGTSLWEWNKDKKSFLEKKILNITSYEMDEKINPFPEKVYFLPGTKGQELIFLFNQNSSLYKLDRNNLKIKQKLDNVNFLHNIYFVPGTKGQEFFTYSYGGELLFFQKTNNKFSRKQLQKSSRHTRIYNYIDIEKFISNPYERNKFLYYFDGPMTKQVWERADDDFKLEKSHELKKSSCITDFKFVPETTGLEHIIATNDKIKYVSPKLLPFNQLELCYSIFKKNKYPLEKNEKATLNNLPKNIQKLAKEKLKKQTKKI